MPETMHRNCSRLDLENARGDASKLLSEVFLLEMLCAVPSCVKNKIIAAFAIYRRHFNPSKTLQLVVKCPRKCSSPLPNINPSEKN